MATTVEDLPYSSNCDSSVAGYWLGTVGKIAAEVVESLLSSSSKTLSCQCIACTQDPGVGQLAKMTPHITSHPTDPCCDKGKDCAAVYTT